jgi:hypothetical protein
MSTPTAKAKAEELFAVLQKGKEVHDLFAESMERQLLISGKTIRAWEDYFKFHIATDDLSPPICKQYDVQLLKLNEEATFFHAFAEAKVQYIKRGGDSTFRNRFTALVQEYSAKGGKLPASATLDNLARAEGDDIESALAIAEIEKKFWAQILDHLTEKRKILDNAGFANNTEAKIFNGSK